MKSGSQEARKLLRQRREHGAAVRIRTGVFVPALFLAAAGDRIATAVALLAGDQTVDDQVTAGVHRTLKVRAEDHHPQ
jgi:hypothetical protein